MGLGSPSVKTVRRLASMLWLLQSSLEIGVKHNGQDLPRFFRTDDENVARLQSVLSQVAWVNVKKASRAEGTKMIPHEVHEHALRNKEILRKQIASCAPHLVIVCGEVPFRALHGLQLLRNNIELGQRMQLQVGDSLPWVLETSHPAYRVWGWYKGLYDIYYTIYDQLAYRLADSVAR